MQRGRTPDPDLFSLKVVARKLHVTPATLRRWRREGKGPPAVKVGRKLGYPRAEYERWLRELPSK